MTCFFQSLIRIFVVCVIIITVHFQNWSLSVAADKINPVCNTTECKKLGDMYMKNRNSFGRPCTDFYDYVCHGWGQQFPKPRSVELWDVVQMMKQNVFLELKKMLEDKTDSNLRDLEATKALYRACMNAPYLGKLVPWVLRNIINRTTVWPIMYPKNDNPPLNMHCWAIDYMYIKEAGESALFDFNFLANEHDNYAIRVVLTPLKSPYGILKQYSDWRKSKLSNYKLFLKSIISKVMPLNQKLSDAIDDDINTVIQFREELREIIERTKSDVVVRISLQNFQNFYDQEKQSQIAKSYITNSQVNAEINWLFMLRAMYKTPEDPDGLRISANTMIFVQKEYFSALAELLANTPRKIIVNHVHLYFLERHIEIDSSLRILLKNSITLGIQRSGAIRYEKERFKTCITNNNLKSPLAELYRKTTLTNEKKASIIAMIDEAKEVLRDESRKSNWMNNRIRKHVNDKINKLRNTIGYTGRTVLAQLDSIMPYTCYVAEQNQIYVTAAFLNSPMYTANVPYQIQYGSTMAILGHEIYHAFDSLGMMYDGDGHSATISTQMREAYLNQTKCFSDFYDKFQDKAFRKLDFSFYTIDSADTAEEDLADAMGLKLAYKAYRRKLKENNGICSVLPGFEESSCDQMFFIAYANNLCSASSISILERDLIFDIHSGDQLRINAAVANMEEFSKAFACKANDTLNVQQRCDFWK